MLLTNMIVFPNITQHNITGEDHGYAAKSSLLHVNVLVVISFIAWKRIHQMNIFLKLIVKMKHRIATFSTHFRSKFHYTRP